MGCTIREKGTYALVCCLLKFPSCIWFNEVVVKTDHSRIVQWYKEDMCTISGPLGRRGRMHEFLSRFNLIIEYLPGDGNDDGDTLSRWAYPAGAAQDTNFHRSDENYMGWTEVERKEKVAQEQILRERYPDAFDSCTAKLRKEQKKVISLGDWDQQVLTLRTCYEQAQAQSPIDFNQQYVLPDGSRTSNFSTLTNDVYQVFSVHHLSDDLLPPMTKHQMGSCLRNLS